MAEPLKQCLRTSYDRKAADRDRLPPAPWKVDERQTFLVRLHSEDRRSLLELGSGPGRDGLFFQDHGMTVTCTDLSPEMIARCRQKGLTALVMDMADLQFAPGSFDAVYAMNSLLHQPKRELPAVLRGIRRVLAPGGLFYMGVWGGSDFEGILTEDSYQPKRFFSFYADGPLQEVVSKVFEIVAFKSISIPHRDKEYQYQSLTLRNQDILSKIDAFTASGD